MIIQTSLVTITVLVALCCKDFWWFFCNFSPIGGGSFTTSRVFSNFGSLSHLIRPEAWICGICTQDSIPRKPSQTGNQILLLICILIHLWAPHKGSAAPVKVVSGIFVTGISLTSFFFLLCWLDFYTHRQLFIQLLLVLITVSHCFNPIFSNLTLRWRSLRLLWSNSLEKITLLGLSNFKYT